MQLSFMVWEMLDFIFLPFYILFSPSSDIQRVPLYALQTSVKAFFMVDCISSSPLSSSFVTVYTATKAPFSSLVFICLKNSYCLTSFFVDEFLWCFKRHKITIFNLIVAPSTQTCQVKYAYWCPPGCDIIRG